MNDFLFLRDIFSNKISFTDSLFMPSIWISSSLTNPPVTMPSSGARMALPVSGSIPALEIKLDKSKIPLMYQSEVIKSFIINILNN